MAYHRPVNNPQAQLILKPGRERSLQRRHPWVFSGAVAESRGNPQPGATVQVCAASGEFLAWAAYSPQSQIQARVWSWQEDETIDRDFLRRRLQRALDARRGLKAHSDSWRLVHAESDRLPGLVVDRYGQVLVLQCLSWGAEAWRDEIVALLIEMTQPAAIYERSDVDVRRLEGLAERSGLLWGELPEETLSIEEHGLQFAVQLASGHKTGFYLDQRANRLLLRSLVEGRQVLDCFAYSGGFALNALKGGAAGVTLVEESETALELARQNLAANGFAPEAADWMRGDVFHVLRRFRDEGRQFDLIVLDPPKFAPTRAQAERAARGYKDINLLALKLLRPGGQLLTFSCSGGVDADLFQKIVAGAALDAGVEARILQRLGAGPDHPVALNFPEGEYLKGLLIEVE
ncbi:MAG: class I SAM-dependent methyltransferase [Anaerolineales bacterium]|nr:class I SAM-dependent methyltransferase [Anaerolineales bacterium]MCW5855053.1 class I SAM-dependent methyltransferase [Anaerolineales bacterium]